MSESEKGWIKNIAIGVMVSVFAMIVTVVGGMYRTSIVLDERDGQNQKLFEKIDNRLENFENKIDNIKDNYVKKNDYESDKRLMMIKFKNQTP